MPEYTFRGTVKLNGCTFFVTAANEAEAKQRAKAGEFSYYVTDNAETTNWSLDPNTCESNE